MAFATLMLVGLGTVVASRRASPGAPILMAATGGPIRYGDESLMAGKAHGSCVAPVQPRLRWGCDGKVADNICCFNRHFAERSGYWAATSFLKEANREKTVFRDPVTGRPLFVAPVGRSFSDFEAESRQHGWPSFRQNEVVWANVRVLPNGETVSVDGTHLGHNLPDRKGARYCINLVSISGHTPGGGSDDDDSDVPVGDGQPAPAAAK
ncbi:hypothetical protein KFE25_014162 [Diacronema lutheri]|uniref:Uncharacterized protein n=1 Tax=Diacronema lutheri TaxID=2081491 RepID=A0A8J5XEJ3_DIALT|nr:hypothetical protein KFE25_014162 [Diacronema lutheri]